MPSSFPETVRYNFNSMPLHSVLPIIQAKLTVNIPEDDYEKEAEATADKVVRMPDTLAEQPKISPVAVMPGKNELLAKEDAKEEKEKENEEKEEEKKETRIQRKRAGNAHQPVSAAVNQVLASSGQPLDPAVLSFMEPRFGFDFSKVQIHDDALAHRSAKDINALAYTHQHKIVFGAGQYQPGTGEGKKLLAHELTHVVQQQKGSSGEGLLQRAPDKNDEQEIYDAAVYETAIPVNLANWETRDRFYNLFVDVVYGKGKGIFPGSTPVAYVNHVYAIQKKMKDLWQAEYLGKVNGIIDDRLLTDLQTLAENYQVKGKTSEVTYGIDTAILERFLRIQRNAIVGKLLSSGLGNYAVFNLISQNGLFSISLNNKGAHITYLKTVLAGMHYLEQGDISDIYDQQTYDAVKKFQRDTGMVKADGLTGAKTLQMIDSFLTGRSSVFIAPGSRFYSSGLLSETIAIFTDGDGDQKKELRLVFGKKGNAVTLSVYHTDTKETKGPLSFTFPSLHLADKMWVHEYSNSNGLEPTIIKIEPVKKAEETAGIVADPALITIQAPTPAGPGTYYFNDQPLQFNSAKFEPLYGFATDQEINITNPTIEFDIGPYMDGMKLFFKDQEAIAAPATDTAGGRIYSSQLYLIGQGTKNIAFGGKPMEVQLKSTELCLNEMQHDSNILSFDLDNDGMEDLVLHYKIEEAGNERGPAYNRYIQLFFTGPALKGPEMYQFEKLGDYFVIHEVKSEELFKQLVPALGNEGLNKLAIPENRETDIDLLNGMVGYMYLKALEEGIIQGDTYLAWKNLEIALQYLNLFVKGKTNLTDDDLDKISKTAAIADDYMQKIRRDTLGKETAGHYAVTAGDGMGSSTSYEENPYSGDTKSSTTAAFHYSTSTTSIELGEELQQQKWDSANASYEKLANGFNLWVQDRLREKHPEDTTFSGQTRNAFLFAKGLESILNNPDATQVTRVKALYYSYDKYLKEEGVPVIELPLYYYYDTSSHKWWIVDFINPSAPYKDHIELAADEQPGSTPPASLFEKLNDKDHLPKGMLLYATPDKSISGQVELTEEWETKDILAWLAAAVGIAALIGSVAISGGAATPFAVAAIEVMFAVSAIAGGMSAGMDLYEHYKNEDLTPVTAMLDVGSIAASIVGLSSLTSGRIIYLASKASVSGTPWMGAWASLARTADQAWVPLAGLNIGINGFNIAILSSDTIAKLQEMDEPSGTDQAAKDRAKILLLANLAFNAGLTILSLKGDIASFERSNNILIYPDKNGIPVAVSAAEGFGLIPVEELSLRSQEEFDQVLAIREKMFGEVVATEIKIKLKDNTVFMDQYRKLNREVFDILNDPAISVVTKKQMLGEKIEAYERLMASQQVLDKTVFNATALKEMTQALDEASFGMRMTMKNGSVFMEGTEFGKFPDLVERVKLANQSMNTNGSEQELVIIIMPSVSRDGRQEILLLSRKRWTILSGAKAQTSLPLDQIGTPSAIHQQYIIDVGSGTSSFAIDMIPAAGREGSTILNTEYAPTFMEPAMTRSDLTWKNAAAKTDNNTVVVIGDPLTNMHEMVGDKTVRQVFINHVNAHYNDQQYAHLAEELAQCMDDGGRVMLQWTDKLEYSEALQKEIPRGHIEGEKLEAALLVAAEKYGRKITVDKEQPLVLDYEYGITPSKKVEVTPDKPLTDKQRKRIDLPKPKYRWDFIFH